MKKILTATVLAAVMLCIVQASLAQDSLHLVMTFTGESYAERITDAVGVGDVNGDGYDDFAVSRLGSVRLYLGGAKFDTSRFVELNTGGNVAGAGDVNGDGYDDILIASQFNSGGERKGIVRLYLGGRDIDTTADFSFYDKKTGMDAMGSVSGAGDVNGDGYGDFLVGESYNWTDAAGKAYLFLGGTTLPAEPAVTFVSDSVGDNFGYSVRGIGDVNGDGFDDIAISAIGGIGRVCLYLGGDSITNMPYAVLKPGEGDVGFGNDIEKAGDLNGDGGDDFLVTSEKAVYIYFRLDSVIRLDGSEMGFGGYVSAGTGGDINHDGYDDIIIGNTNHRNAGEVMVGGCFLYSGGEQIDTAWSCCKEGETKWGEFGRSVSIIGDYNGDGYDEAIVVAPGYPDTTYEQLNRLGKVYVYSYKKIDAIISPEKPIEPDFFHLQQNYPNPFNPATTIEYQIRRRSKVVLKIFDVLGREIGTLVNQQKPAGEFKLRFDANRYHLSAGVYFYELTIDDKRVLRSMMLIK